MMDMAPKHSQSRLSAAGQWWLAAAVLSVMAGMGIAFWYSFANLSAAAAAHGWHPPFLLPLVIDTGIPAYVIVDQLIVAMGWRSWLPRLAAWGLAVLTVFLNGAVSADPSPLWRVTHAAMPAAWIIGIESLRLLWRVLQKGPAGQRKRIPLARWLLARQSTWELWKRMRLWDITDYGEAVTVELARLRAIEALSVRYRDWRSQAPGDLVWMLDNGVCMDEALARVAELTAPVQAAGQSDRSGVNSKPRSGSSGHRSSGRKSKAGSARVPRVPSDVDTQAEALSIVTAEPDISGPKLAERLGVSESYGCRLKKKFAPGTAPATGEQPRVS